MKPKAILVDLDGTLADNEVRATPEMTHWKDYIPLYQFIPKDEIQQWCDYLVAAFRTMNVRIILLTARPEEFRKMTEQWLREHDVEYDDLFMMPDDYSEKRTVTDFKKEKTRALLNDYDVLFAVDDSMENCAMFYELGIQALWVTK